MARGILPHSFRHPPGLKTAPFPGDRPERVCPAIAIQGINHVTSYSRTVPHQDGGTDQANHRRGTPPGARNRRLEPLPAALGRCLYRPADRQRHWRHERPAMGRHDDRRRSLRRQPQLLPFGRCREGSLRLSVHDSDPPGTWRRTDPVPRTDQAAGQPVAVLHLQLPLRHDQGARRDRRRPRHQPAHARSARYHHPLRLERQFRSRCASSHPEKRKRRRRWPDHHGHLQQFGRPAGRHKQHACRGCAGPPARCTGRHRFGPLRRKCVVHPAA